jgi:hypothetical protein
MLVLLFTGVAAPIAGLLFHRVAGGWDSVGRGPFAIEQQLPLVPRYLAQPAATVDPAIQAAEVRQMLRAKSERRQDAELRAEVRQLVVSRNERRMRSGLEPLDVDAEIDRQLDDFVGSP